jgi:excisionase family DNA binding protein
MKRTTNDQEMQTQGNGTTNQKGITAEVRLLTVVEIAERLQVSPAMVYTMVSKGRIPHRRVGRLVRFSLVDVLDWSNHQSKIKTAGNTQEDNHYDE